MRIYLDESKRLWKWKIVFWWFITTHSNKNIENFIKSKKVDYKIFDNVELKWSKPSWKYFYDRMINENNFQILNNSIIWINIYEYYKDDFSKYKKIIKYLLLQNFNYIKNYKKDINIIADYVNYWKNTQKIEKEIEKYLNGKFNICWKINFEFKHSNTSYWIQLSDLIAYKLGKSYFYWEQLDDFILENNFNIDLNNEFKV